MDPDVNCRKSKKRVKACGKALPTHDSAAILLLEPGKGALRLKAWDGLFDRSPPVFFRLPDPLRDLRPDPALAELLPQHLGTLVPLGRRGPVGEGHAAALREAVAQDPLALAPVGDALAPTLARGKTRHRRRHTPNESSRVPRQSPESGLASRRACHPPASVVTSDAWRSSTPIVGHGGHHTTGSR